jgi:hypothetical protein
MRPLVLSLLLVAAPAAAQMPARTVTFDAASAFEQRYRTSIEAAVFGRFTAGLGVSYTHDDDRGALIVPPTADPCQPDVLCQDVSARWYPAALAFRRGELAAGAYVGEFIGYHHRTLRVQVPFGCPPEMLCGGAAGETQRFSGIEPGMELGIRLMPTRHFVADIGGRFRLATFGDAFTRQEPGDVDARFVVGLGLRW